MIHLDIIFISPYILHTALLLPACCSLPLPLLLLAGWPADWSCCCYYTTCARDQPASITHICSVVRDMYRTREPGLPIAPYTNMHHTVIIARLGKNQQQQQQHVVHQFIINYFNIDLAVSKVHATARYCLLQFLSVWSIAVAYLLTDGWSSWCWWLLAPPLKTISSNRGRR